jgi:peptidoglycan/xylan/chitin deacetylase (PgdA/CDA1 family)
MQGYLKVVAITASFAAFLTSMARGNPDDSTRNPLRVPNELGQVMILMYHEIGDRESTWSRKAENFQKDLKALYVRGYRPISLRDFVNNEISTPQGFSPVVLTFDDGTKGQFAVDIRDGQKITRPTSAVGILESFHGEHPDFPLEATFFLNGRTPFHQPALVKYKLNYLIAKGFDIGNHSRHHKSLAKSDMQTPAKIQRELGIQSVFLKKTLTDHPSYQIDTLALCFGARPRTPRLRAYLRRGTAKGLRYDHIAVLNVGSGPAFSPADARLNPLSIPRIRASDHRSLRRGFGDWLAYFESNPDERYVSDGDADTVTVKRGMERHLSPERLGSRRVALRQE